MNTVIALASDHGGRLLKNHIAKYLEAKQYTVIDFGVATEDSASVDYPDYAIPVAKAVTSGKANQGILVCGTGIGMSIAANKVHGIRAAVVWDDFSAEMAKAHNNANILCLGERCLDFETATKLMQKWLDTKFEGGRHLNRTNKITELEK
jgi:ribose 5-phosphate isomerase B